MVGLTSASHEAAAAAPVTTISTIEPAGRVPDPHRPRGQSPHRPFTGVHIALLLGITLLAAVMRLYRLDQWSMWVDEAHSWRDATMPLGGDDGFMSSPRKWYPATFLMLRWLLDLGWLPYSGGHAAEGWLRLPFAFCGIVTVPLLALVGNLFVGRRAALLAALFLALNPWHIYFSQNVRGYVMVFFFATLAAGLFQVGTQRGSWWWRGASLLAVLIGSAFHPTTLLLLAPFAAYPWLSGVARLDWRFWLKVSGMCVVAILAARVATFLPPFEVFLSAKPDASLTHLVETTAYYFRVPLLVTAVVGVWLLFQTRLQGRILFLACWSLVPLLVLAVLGASVVKVTARYALCALPAVVLLSGAGAVRITEALVAAFGRSSRLGKLVPALVVPVMLVLDMASYDYLYYTSQHGDRGMWREAKDFLVGAVSPGRKLLVYTINAPSMNFYLRPLYYAEPGLQDADPDRSVVQMVWWDVWDEEDAARRHRSADGRGYFESRLRDAAGQGQELFVVITLPELQEMDRFHPVAERLETALGEQFELVKVFPVAVGPKDETIYIYRAARDARTLLLAQLRSRFGVVPAALEQRVRDASAGELRRLGLRLLSASQLEAVFER